jgi:hypothetical protein
VNLAVTDLTRPDYLTLTYFRRTRGRGSPASSTCNASNGNTIGSSCIFYDVTLGDNDVVAHHKRQRPFARDRWQIALVRRCKDVLAQHLSDVPDASAADAAIIRRASVLIVELELVRHFAAGAR